MRRAVGVLALVGLLLVLGAALAWAVNSLRYDVGVTVTAPSLVAVGPTSLTLSVEQGGCGSFTAQVQNTNSASISASWYSDLVTGFTATLPTGVYSYTWQPSEVKSFAWSICATSTVSLGSYSMGLELR